MRISLGVLIAALGLATSVAAEPTGWRVEGTPGAPPFRLSYTPGGAGEAYSFECRADGILVKETGVTQLLDLQTGKKISDEPGGSITPGAALLALATDPNLKLEMAPATATPNPMRGWDLSILLPKTDKQWRAFPHAQMVSLMTSGWTAAVEVDGPARSLIADFVKACGA